MKDIVADSLGFLVGKHKTNFIPAGEERQAVMNEYTQLVHLMSEYDRSVTDQETAKAHTAAHTDILKQIHDSLKECNRLHEEHARVSAIEKKEKAKEDQLLKFLS